MARTLADIDRDIAKANSQMRGAIADLARLSREREWYAPEPTTRQQRKLARRLHIDGPT